MNFKFQILFALFLLSACNEKSDQQRELTDEEKVAQRTWCYAETLSDNLNFVNKLSFKIENANKYYSQKKMSRETILFTDKLVPTVYPFAGSISWEISSDVAKSYSGYRVQLLEKPESIFDGQDLAIKRISSLNSDFAASKKSSPDAYLLIKYQRGFSSEEETLFAYPCEAYSDYVVDFRGRRGSKLEHDLYASQEVWSWNHKYDDKEYLFERDMPIHFPIETQTNIKNTELQGSAWCSWHQHSDLDLRLEVVTFGENSFSTVSYSDGIFEMFSNEADVLNFFDSKANDAPVSQIESIKDGLITAKTDFQILDLPTSTLTSHFYVIKDSENTPILVSSALGQSAFIFEFLYFPCDDKRALKNSPIFAKHLPQIIKNQKKYLQD
jgi:hypothetical protein